MRPHLEYCSTVLLHLCTGQTLNWREASTEPLKWPGSRSTWQMRTGLKNWACVAWRRDGARGAEHNCGYFPNKKECVWSCRKQRQIFLRDALWQDKKQLTQAAAMEIPTRIGKRKKKKPTKNNHPQKITLRGVKHYTIAQKGGASPPLEVYKTQLDKVLSNLIQFLT